MEEEGFGIVKRPETNRWLIVIGCAIVTLVLMASVGVAILIDVYGGDENNTPSPDTPKTNIIFLLADGFGPSFETFARQWDNSSSLPLDSWLVGHARTDSSSSLVTDSAAGATAYSCGAKSYNGAIGVLPAAGAGGLGPDPAIGRDDPPQICGTLLEAAGALGMNTAVVVTSRITHATPASFIAHMSYRDYEEQIAAQIAANTTVNLLFGGGQDQFEYRSDGQNITTQMTNRGYRFIQTAQEMSQITSLENPVIGLFAKEHMDFEIDRVLENPITQPSLPDMVTKALSLLSGDKKPFFLMIEGSRIDMGAHNNDAATVYGEIMTFQKVISIVQDFVDKNPNTFVVSVADHSTGGMTVGSGNRFNFDYPIYTWYPNVLKQQTASVEYMLDKINAGITYTEALATYANITDLNQDEINWLNKAFATVDNKAKLDSMGDVISNRAQIGFTTPGHTGEDINIYSYGKIPSSLRGVMRNTDVGNIIANEFGLRDKMNEIAKQLSSWMTFPLEPFGNKKRDGHEHEHIYGYHD
eukprot:TRINITY_DN5846_c0_g1_i1.p1 TRINITY_DN5846_c0_g1~~TRINITY_DN5846_c0_g1_i1.p1  ORF type:complete len:527 (+),score=238.39 TRINITY_DN5846_c0_g1_i1:69-1649(+)